MRIVEIYPREDSFITALHVEPQAYFKGEAHVLSLILENKRFGFVCHEEGVQIKNNKVKALYGPAIVCGEELQELSNEEATFVQSYINNNQFDLSHFDLH
ncbi:hypothetical protein JCM9140_1100 [Halalkalibacter wakoensis JCM 9140]|uniref:Uncharacterized protein n=1 Tax=Halalkalibacter wakoensis JCM 9140 TaxID=1236970 RepID=W4PZG0_9BACI|nr:hypothetical protein [Halalkalibacter wakoensis]GAE25127.1 hypothetical protein JCM9140_1100 [Halalkalibacter wakoensis JCM 9140]